MPEGKEALHLRSLKARIIEIAVWLIILAVPCAFLFVDFNSAIIAAGALALVIVVRVYLIIFCNSIIIDHTKKEIIFRWWTWHHISFGQITAVYYRHYPMHGVRNAWNAGRIVFELSSGKHVTCLACLCWGNREETFERNKELVQRLCEVFQIEMANNR